MIKKISLYSVFILFLFLILFNVITNPTSFYNNIIGSLSVWLYNVYPALFTFYIIASCLINFNIIKRISFVAKPFIKFETQKAYELFITGIFVGNPSTASLIVNEYDANNISINDANKLLRVSSFFNPLYIIAIVSSTFLFDIKYAFVIMVAIFLTNLLMGMFYKSDKKPLVKENLINPVIRLDTVFNAINQAISLLLLVAGIMVFANILKFSLIHFLDLFSLNTPVISFLISQFEISTGLVDIFNYDIPIRTVLPLASFMLGFQGISVNLQVLNIIIDHKFKFMPIFITRIFQGIIAGCITFIIMNII